MDFWHDDTLKKSEGTYKLGIKDGEWIEWGSNGELLVSMIYQEGKEWTGRYYDKFYLEGIEKKGIKIKYPDGVIKEEGILFNEKKIGRWTFYYNNGKRKSTGLYVDGQENGKWYYWYKSGKKEKVGSYFNGI